MALKKELNDFRTAADVHFSLPQAAAKNAQTVHLVGQFNNWDMTAQPMTKQEDGSFETSLTLPTDAAHEFRYLLDGEQWENDWDADKYVPTGVCEAENSVVVL